MHATALLSLVLSASAVLARGHSGSTWASALARSGATTALDIDFSKYTSGTVASFLSAAGISISDYSVASTPDAHAFVPGNVGISNGALTLKVSGGTTNSAEIALDQTFLYGNVTTRARISSVPGTCAGEWCAHLTDDSI